MIVDRREMRDTMAQIIAQLTGQQSPQENFAPVDNRAAVENASG